MATVSIHGNGTALTEVKESRPSALILAAVGTLL